MIMLHLAWAFILPLVSKNSLHNKEMNRDFLKVSEVITASQLRSSGDCHLGWAHTNTWAELVHEEMYT